MAGEKRPYLSSYVKTSFTNMKGEKVAARIAAFGKIIFGDE
jgi:hypothetical protein